MGLKLGRFVAGGAVGMLGILAACSGAGQDDPSAVQVTDVSSKANVAIGRFDVMGRRQGTCSGRNPPRVASSSKLSRSPMRFSTAPFVATRLKLPVDFTRSVPAPPSSSIESPALLTT